jgi:hypothetical protein
MNLASALVLIVIVALLIAAIKRLLKKGSGCAACGHKNKDGCGFGCDGCSGCCHNNLSSQPPAEKK